MQKKAQFEKKVSFNFYQYIWIFIAAGLLGYLVETLWCLIKNGYIESRKSLVLGHLSLAYSIGAVLLTLVLVRFQNSKPVKIFLISFVTGTVTEYICSLGQEIIFGSVAWDYSDLPLNINGRVCLLYSLFWGVLGLAWVKLLIPLFNKIFTAFKLPHENILIWAFIAFFVFDCALSAGAALRMNDRQSGNAADNIVEEFLDSAYPDEKMREIYANSESVD
ncbi:MAG: putative ABC transporter permease [Clostridiales bacterium]|nr:putative ABC transporter permease [Clostridiales bacterium]MCD7722760.1 putative ABC transporter permease [Clostridiales bacterium]